MTQAELNQIAKDVIKNNIYLTLATADQTPWASPLYYATDDEYRFYFISQWDSLHVRNILKNPTVAFAVFDSHQKEGAGVGIQAVGTVSLLQTQAEIAEAFTWYHTDFIPMKLESFSGSAPYRFFRIVVEQAYVLDPSADVDRRVEVFLK